MGDILLDAPRARNYDSEDSNALHGPVCWGLDTGTTSQVSPGSGLSVFLA